jgi:hypothetical protein
MLHKTANKSEKVITPFFIIPLSIDTLVELVQHIIVYFDNDLGWKSGGEKACFSVWKWLFLWFFLPCAKIQPKS